MEKRTLTPEEMEQYKRELAPYALLRKEIDLEQAGELLTSYLNEWKVGELAEKWEVKNHNVYDLRREIQKKTLSNIDIPNGRKIEPKQASVTIKKPKEAGEKKSLAASIYEDKIKELEAQIAEQQEELSARDRALEEVHTNAPAENIRVMLELVQEQTEQVAAAVQEAKEQHEDFTGIAFKFEGEFCADTLKKRLDKVVHMIEGEPSTFDITFHLLEKPRKDITPTDGPEKEPIPQEIVAAVEQTENLQKQLDELTMNFLTWEEDMKTMKEQTDTVAQWGNGYTALKTDKQGLHHPKSEYEKKAEAEKSIPERSVITRHGVKCYQSFYHCPKCKDRGKTYTPKGSEYVNCKKCGEGMKKQGATEKGFPNVDNFGNIYIAGDYVPENNSK